MKYQDKNLFYLQKHLATTIDLFNFIESETDVILKWKNNDEAKCHCPMPDHKDNNASFHLKRESDGTVIFHCLGGETGVITWDGIKKIKDIAGTTQKILTTGGHWVDAPFFYFGKQNVVKLTLSRNRQIKTIITTPSHRWFIDRDWNKIKKIKISKEKKTYELKIGEVLHSTFARKPQGIKTISPQGISHGIVYGDGTMSSNINESLVNLWGNKDKQLLKWFPLNRVSKIICPNGLKGLSVVGLPSYYKEKPSLNESSSYLLGFLSGWMASDGHVAKDGTIMLNSSKKENLEFAKLIALRLGIGTYGITCQKRLGINKKMSNLYRVHFVTEDLSARFFLIKEHRERYLNNIKKYSRKRWQIKNIESVSKKEDVFCAVVDKTRSFVLEDNILTGNCFGCEKSGTIVGFCMEYFGLRNKYEAIKFLCNKFDIKNKEDLILAAIKNTTKRVDIQRKVESLNIITSNSCRLLLRKNFDLNKKWVLSAYKEMNKAMEDEDCDTLERIGYEASKRMRS